jgi:hypothetical protein
MYWSSRPRCAASLRKESDWICNRNSSTSIFCLSA